jgi:hypothetical protein
MDRRAFLAAAASTLAVSFVVLPAPARAAEKGPLAVTYYYLPG